MKRLISVFLVICILAALPLSIEAAGNTTVDKARVLYDLGLLKGTGTSFSEEGLELYRNATRAEIGITIVRMLGKEAKANYQANAHPFWDVPSWASNAIGWLYENYLVNGNSATYFGAEEIASTGQFATMLLRVLGYDDSAGDFFYEGAAQFARGKGLIENGAENIYELSRKEMINMCYAALKSTIKNSHRTLIDKLCDEGAVNADAAKASGILKPPSVEDSFASVPQNLGSISASWFGASVRVSFASSVEHYGVRVFIREGDSNAIKELKLSGNPYFAKGQIMYENGSPAGFISELYLYGLNQGKKYEIIVIKTTSEGELYDIVGRSATVNLG